MSSIVKSICTEIEEYYSHVEQSTTDLYLLRDKFSKAHGDLSNVDIAKLQSLVDAINTLKIAIKVENVRHLTDLIKTMEGMQKLVEKNINLIERSRTEFRGTLQKLEKTVSWYDYMIILDENLPLPTGKTTPSQTEVVGSLINACGNADNVDQMDFSKLSPFVPNNTGMLSSLKSMPLNLEKKKKLKNLLSLFAQQPTIVCKSNVMTVTGTVIWMSQVTSDRTCFSNARSIEIFATISVIIDTSVEKTGSNISMAIMAPEWSVIDSQKILLMGSDGEPKSNAANCDRYCSMPPDGEAGNPGETGGNFLGIGGVFVNGRKLTVSSVGGNGGTGSNGGRGSNGVDGSVPTFDDDPSQEIPSCFNYVPGHWICINNYVSDSGYESGEEGDYFAVWKKGSIGTSGGRGGHGGVGGFGGKAGVVKMIELVKKSHVIDGSYNGTMGSPGKGGEGGEKAVKYFVRKCKGTWDHRFFNTHTVWRTAVLSEETTDAGQRGSDGGSTNKRRFQESAHDFDHASGTIKKFKDLLEQSLNGNIRESKTRKFVHEILEKNVQVQQLLSQ